MVNKKDKKKKYIIILAIVMILSIIINIILSNNESEEQITEEQINQIHLDESITKLSQMSEQERMEHYILEFARNIEFKKYKDAYERLYEDFRKMYFPTQEKFEEYIKEYWPRENSLNHTNIERLGDYYVMWTEVTDITGEKNKFSMNIVIRENKYNDFYELKIGLDTKESNYVIKKGSITVNAKRLNEISFDEKLCLFINAL